MRPLGHRQRREWPSTLVLVLLVTVGVIVSSCGTVRDAADTVTQMRDVAGQLRDLATEAGADALDQVEPMEWSDLPETGRYCGAEWSRDDMIATYEEQGLDGLPLPVGFSPSYSSDIDEFYQRYRVARAIMQARERTADRRLITCIVGTRGREDPRDSVGVNVHYINDREGTIERPTLRGVEVSLFVVDPDGNDASTADQDPDAMMRWVGACSRSIVMPPGTYTQTRCLIDGPDGVTSDFADEPDGLAEDGCPDSALTCEGLAFAPSREAFTDILADDVRYVISSRSHTGFYRME